MPDNDNDCHISSNFISDRAKSPDALIGIEIAFEMPYQTIHQLDKFMERKHLEKQQAMCLCVRLLYTN